jgi:hypothetical protein
MMVTLLQGCSERGQRELWVVGGDGNGRAWISPRPDAMGLHCGICDGSDSELATLFRTNGLCEETIDTDEKLETINNMTPENALKITQVLHARLAFDSKYGIVSPYLPQSEHLAVCKFTSDPDAMSYCERKNRCNSCDDMGRCTLMACVFEPSEAEAKAFASAVNQLYTDDQRVHSAVCKNTSDPDAKSYCERKNRDCNSCDEQGRCTLLGCVFEPSEAEAKAFASAVDKFYGSGNQTSPRCFGV